MDKVTVSREVAEAIEGLKGSLIRSEILDLFTLTRSEDGVIYQKQFDVLYENLSLEQLAISLIVGYEVEQTLEEKIKELFEKNLDMYDRAKEDGLDGDAMFRDGRSDGILRTLEILNIKVPGVNE